MIRRTAYIPLAGPERYMVPLLKRYIENALSKLKTNRDRPVRVLDIGAGGKPLRAYVESLNWKYYSADIGEDGCHDFVCSLDIPFPDAITRDPFDVVLCTEVLEHVANWSQAFSNLARSVKTGGYLVLTAPFIYQLHEQPYDYWRPTCFAVQKYAADYGFKIVDETRMGDGLEILATISASLGPIRPCENRGRWLFARYYNYLFVFFLKYFVPWLHRAYTVRCDGYYLSNAYVFEKL